MKWLGRYVREKIMSKDEDGMSTTWFTFFFNQSVTAICSLVIGTYKQYKASIFNCFQKQHLLVYLWIHRLFLHCFCSLGSFSFSHPFQTFLSEKSPNHVQIVLRPLCTFLHCFVISLLSMSHCIPFLWDTAFAKLQIKTAQEWWLLSQLPHRRSLSKADNELREIK